ncbi:MAG: TolC family outer membrane protein [Pseudomonadota bacterium]
MRNLPVMLLISGALLVPWSASAQDLAAVYELAAENDPQLRAAAAARAATQEAKPQSRALLFPTLSLDANTNYNDLDIRAPAIGTSRFNSNGYTLNLTQPVYRHETYAQIRQADARIGQAEAEYSAAQQELIVRVATRYFDVLAAQDNLEFAHAEKESIARQLEQSRQRFDVGLVAITDVHEAQARYDLAVAQEIDAENQLSTARETLREVTGRYHEDLAPLMTKIPLLTPEPSNIETWVDTALKQNLQISAADFAAQVAREEIDRRRAGHYPTLDIVGSSGYTHSGGGRFGASQIDSNVIGIQLNAPLFQGGLVNARVREAEHLRTQALEILEQQRRAVLRQTRASYLSVLAGISRVDALGQAIVSNQSALDAAEAGLEVGTRTAVEVLDARRELFRAKRDYARARYDYILETLRLKQAAGTLSPSDVQQINTWLQ